MKLIFVLTLTLGMVLSARGQSKIVNQRKVYDKMVKAGVAHPKIVLKQAIHESANFKNKRAQQQNNYLGLMKRGRLIRFESLDACIDFYKRVIQSRYDGGDYYRFLHRIGYATDPAYKQKVKKVELDFIIE